jgi:hypothetical protein
MKLLVIHEILLTSLKVVASEAEDQLVLNYVRFEVFTAVIMNNGVFWDVTPYGYCKNRRFGGT